VDSSNDLRDLLEEYLPVISHDVRTPLTAIKGAAGILAGGLSGSISDQQAKLVDITRRNTDLATYLVQDVVDVLRLKTGLVQPCPVEFNLVTEARDVWNNISFLTTLRTDFSAPDGEVMMVLDRHYYRRVINALIRFPQGEKRCERVSLSISRADSGARISLESSPCCSDMTMLNRMLAGPVRDRRPVQGRLPVTGLELQVLKATEEAFGILVDIQRLPEDALRIDVTWSRQEECPDTT
jgi:light-regulated signal transduction histidine kinase (bacteriophytochrome)